ncbi:hypothetical protein [Halogranum rubrum]|uniref:Uncharacterized protein n=1 Tax=Halogranum salarium B-1 TaxID=1210908 RepID=J3A7I5_9EURY|nr:hypothetical protein [Halogranum salarium]EJN61578.1 hypothetical protein HSB1_06190 [Halogranum salarium B-1]
MSGDVPVDAVCTGCSQTRVKRVSEEEAEGSFRHVCHVCQSVQWMNTVARLSGLEQGGDGE